MCPIIADGLHLITFIPAIILFSAALDSVDTYEKEFTDVFQEIADSPTQFRIGLASTMVASFLSVLLGGALYLTLSPAP